MGVYHSAPITEKVSLDNACKNFVYGASSMQGWRMTQEDAHNCCPDFDPDKNGSLFAVYDGHGGAEVAQYTSIHLPDFIKSLKSYQDGDYKLALEEAFLLFDATLVEDNVIEELKALAGDEPGEEDEGAPEVVGKREADMLCAEANMPLDELLAKYEPSSGVPLPIKDIRKKENIFSPMISNKHSMFESGGSGLDLPGGSSNNSSHTTFAGPLVTNLQGKLSNGHAENENNLNAEKERQNNQNQNSDFESAESGPLTISTGSSVMKYASRLTEQDVSAAPSVDSTTSHVDEKQKSKKSSVSNSSCTAKDFVNSSMEQESSALKKAEQSSDDTSSLSENKRVQNNSSQSVSSKQKSKIIRIERIEDCDGSQCSNDGPSSSGYISKIDQPKADSSGNENKIGSEVNAEVCTKKASDLFGSEDGPGGSGGSGRCGKGPDGSPDQPGGSGGSSDKLFGSGRGSSQADDSSGRGASSGIENEEAGGSGAAGIVKTQADRPDLITRDDSDDDDEDDDEYEEDSEEEDYDDDDNDDDDDDDEEEEGEVEGSSGFHQCVDMTNEEPGSDSGCTACLALFLGKDLYVANAGDSRCVLSRAGKAVELSFDHKPEDDIERQRIEKAGGKVTSDGRVNGGLNLSRALGDHYYKRNEKLPPQEQMISALPDIEHVTLCDDDEFIVIACDGIWNYMSSDDVISMVGQELKDPEKRKRPSVICEKMFNHCLAPNTFGDGTGCDNMTCIIIVLKPTTADTIKRCAGKMDSCSSTEEGLAEKRTKFESDSPMSCSADTV